MQFETANGVLIARNGGEMLRIEPWGKNSLRVRATMLQNYQIKTGHLQKHQKAHMLRLSVTKLTTGLVTALLISVSLPLSQMDAYAQLLTLQVLSHFTVTADSFYASIIAATMAH